MTKLDDWLRDKQDKLLAKVAELESEHAALEELQYNTAEVQYLKKLRDEICAPYERTIKRLTRIEDVQKAALAKVEANVLLKQFDDRFHYKPKEENCERVQFKL
jgi:galactose-1-phosphate uridylyltransferase